MQTFADSYGIAVRAGLITPNLADEEYIRAKLGMPAVTDAVTGAWIKDGGSRRPITLQGVIQAQQEAAAKVEQITNSA